MSIHQDPILRTLPRALEAAASEWKDKPLVTFPDAVVSYRELLDRTRLFAGALQSLGVTKGDTVAVLLSNRWEYLETWWGICWLGAIEVPVNFGLKGRLLEHVLADSQARVLVTEEQFIPVVEPLLSRQRGLETIVLVGDRTAAIDGRAVITFGDLPRRKVPPAPLRYGDLACIMYTSGSTGPAKGVMLSHNYFLRFGEEKAKHLRTRAADTIYNVYPLFNASGQLEAVMAALLTGASVYQARHFSASGFWHDIKENSCTEFIYMGGILSILDKAEAGPADSDNPVRVGYGVPTPADLHPRFENRFGCVLVEVYGSTEANTVTFNPYDARKWGSCGLPTSGYEVRLVDQDDNEVGVHEPGEALVRPKFPHSILEGYWHLPEKTLEAFRGLWYRTGDLLRRDDDGYLYFVGRKAECIRHRGYTISASEIESVVDALPGVLESTAVGLPDGQGEEDIKLLIVPKPGARLDPERLRVSCQSELPVWMVPRYVEIRKELPKTPTQKIEKFRLKDEGVTPDTVDFGVFRPRRADVS